MYLFLRSVLIIVLLVLFCTGCVMYEDDREMRKMDDAMEANLNDELNETEREAVDPIFEKNRKARERDRRAVFGP